MAQVRGAEPYGAVVDRLQRAMRQEVPDPRQTLIDLLGALVRLADPLHEEQAGFWRRAAQPVIEAFARSLLESASDGLGQREVDGLRTLLRHAELPVLAADLGKLRHLHAAAAPKHRIWTVPPASVLRPAIQRACLLGNGNMLVWRESRLMQLLDRHGATLWQRNISDVLALVAVGSGPNVLIVQAQSDGTHLLTRFATHSRTFHPVGRVKLTAIHDITSESQWLGRARSSSCGHAP